MSVRGDIGELFDEMMGDGLMRSEGALGEGDRLVGWGVSAFA